MLRMDGRGRLGTRRRSGGRREGVKEGAEISPNEIFPSSTSSTLDTPIEEQSKFVPRSEDISECLLHRPDLGIPSEFLLL